MSACFFTLISLAVAPKEATSIKSFMAPCRGLDGPARPLGCSLDPGLGSRVQMNYTEADVKSLEEKIDGPQYGQE